MLKKTVLGIMLVLLMINATGCLYLLAGAAGGAGTAVWLSGKLVQEVEAPFERVNKATKAALKSLKLDIEKETLKDEVAQFISKYSDGRKIWIDVNKLAASRSKIQVRVGAKGDKAASREILDRILYYL